MAKRIAADIMNLSVVQIDKAVKEIEKRQIERQVEDRQLGISLHLSRSSQFMQYMVLLHHQYGLAMELAASVLAIGIEIGYEMRTLQEDVIQ